MSNRLLTTMQTNVGNNVQDTSTNFLSLTKVWINDRYTEILRRVNFFTPARNDYSFTTSAGTEDYVLADDVSKIITVTDKTNKFVLKEIDQQQWIDGYYDQLDTNGLPVKYMVFDSTVRKQPTSASVLTVVSSSASDNSSFKVYVRGIVSGREDYEEISLNGTTNSAGSKSWDRILSISKSTATTGTITCTTNSGGVTIAVLSREMLDHRVKIMRLVMIPTGSYDIEISYIQKVMPLNNQYDYPLIDCADAIEAGATADAWRYKRQFAKAADMEVIFEKRVADLIWEDANRPNVVHVFSPKPYLRDSTI